LIVFQYRVLYIFVVHQLEDTIAAIITPIGEGGIAVLRVSGKQAIEVADRGFRGQRPLAEVPTQTVHVGHFIDPLGAELDEVVATIFREPHSYTTEDVVELSCHGSSFVAKRILSALLAYGARMAEPGEFTKRAFLHGRIDLSQAEAVAELIRSQSDVSHKASLRQLEGALSERVGNIREKLIQMCGLLELELDFVEENIQFTDRDATVQELESLIFNVSQIIDSYEFGRICRDGVKVVIAGKTNVGKSSLLNALLDIDRSIVTNVSGTTRDVIEENICIGGMIFRLVDTAGLRETEDIVELEGIRRTEEQLRAADLVLFVIDATEGYSGSDFALLRNILGKAADGKSIVVINKIDLLNGEMSVASPCFSGCPTIPVSAVQRLGLDTLRDELLRQSSHSLATHVDSSVVITNARHQRCLTKVKESIGRSLKALRKGESNELIALDLRIALDTLGEITGVVTTDDVLNEIFSKFCIGK
jgi:tRNA modification GTPase